MTFETETAYNELRTHFGRLVKRDELLARHSTFGVGGVADVWVSLDNRADLISLVSRCADRQWPLLFVGNGTNVLYADAGVRGIVARIALNSYAIEDQRNGHALLVAEAGVSWPRLL